MKARGVHDTFHCSLLKPYDPETFGRYDNPLPPIQIQYGIESEVETILDSESIRGKTHFLVKWKGYGDHEDTWQTREDLHNSREFLHEYETSKRRSPQLGEGSYTPKLPFPFFLAITFFSSVFLFLFSSFSYFSQLSILLKIHPLNVQTSAL